MAETIAFKYRAFLSYSHRDTTWGKWLHAALEGYRIDKDLVGRDTPAGPIPKSLRPIFRDREDFSAGHSLTEQTLAALEASQFLVVLCSPNAAKSQYVDEEVRRFKALGRADRIIPLIVGGEPGHPQHECFPPALRFRLAPDGTLSDTLEEPIAADARPQGDGREIAKQKIVAGLLGVGLDEIVKRAERARKRRNRFWAALAGVFLLLAVAATASAAYAWHELKTNEAFLNATLKTANEIVNTAVAQAEKYNVPRSATLELLARAEVMFDDMARLGRPTAELRYQKAWMLIQFARNYAILGDSVKQRARATEAYALLAQLAEEKPSDLGYQRDLAVTYNEVGDVQLAQGNLAEALKSYRASVAIAERLTKTDPDNTVWQRDLSLSEQKIGDALVAAGNLAEALGFYRNSLAISQRLADADPGNAIWQYDLGTSHERIGDILVAQGDLAAALKEYEAKRDIATRLAAADARNVGRQRDLSVAANKIGDVLVAQGNLSEALKAYRDALAISERLTRTDPENTGWRGDVAVSHERIGDVLIAQGDLAGALKEYTARREIIERLAKADPKNAVWQRDLSVAYEKVGDALAAQGNVPDALKAYRDSLAIRERLVQSDVNNAGWQRDLSVAYNKVGDMLAEQGNLPDALKAYRDGLAIRERLANADPNNAGWQRDLSVADEKLGDALAAQSDLSGALTAFRNSLAIREKLAKSDPSNAGWQRDLAVSYERVGDIQYALKNEEDAKTAFAQALAIYTALLAKYPDNTLVLVSSTVPLIRLGALNGAKGRSYFEKALAILKQLDEAGRLEPRRKPLIAWLEAQLVLLENAETTK